MPQANSLDEVTPSPATSAARHFAWWQAWTRSLFLPTPENYRTLIADPSAGARRALTWLAMAGLMLFVVRLLGMQLIDEFGAYSRALARGVSWTEHLSMALELVLLVVFSVLAAASSAHGIARGLGGKGRWSISFYAFAVFSAPLWVLFGVVLILGVDLPTSVFDFSDLDDMGQPYFLVLIGLCLGAPLALIYLFALDVVALASVHERHGARTLVAALPAIVVQTLGLAVATVTWFTRGL